MDPNEMLSSIQAELKTFIAKQQDEVQRLGSATNETKSAIETLIKRIDAIEVKNARPTQHSDGPSILDTLKENKDVSEMLRRRGGRASITFEGRAAAELIEGKNISSAGIGFPTYGVMPAEREAGIVTIARPQLRMRSVLPSRPTTLGEIYWVTETARPTKASPITEYSGLKPLTEPTFSTDKEPVQTIAILALASKQVLEDWTELEGFLRSELSNRVREEEDLQILSGSGVSPNLNGLTTQAQAWDISLLTASDGYEYCDMVSGAMQQVAEDNEEQANQFAVLHPGDAWKIRRLKDTTGRYLFDGPYSPPGPLTLWGAPCVESTQMTKGYFLVGSGSPRAAEIRDRMSLTVEMSTEDSTNFRYNLVTFRAELRLALVVKRPNAFVYGALTQSPA